MPGSNSETTLARQWELLRNHLPHRPPGRSARDLCERLEKAGHKVEKRTIERDLVELSRIFPISRNEVSTPYGWHWSEGARLEIPGMELSEAVSLALMEDVLRQLMPAAFLGALESKFSLAREKLGALPKIPHARWSDLVRYVPPGLPFLPPAMAPGVVAAAQEALLGQRQLKVIYLSAGSERAKELFLHPLSMIQQGTRSYLVATAFEYDLPLLYALHRIASAAVLDEPARRLDGYSLDGFLEGGGAQFAPGKPVVLRARVSDELALLLEETPISKDQKITVRAGIRTLTATVRTSWQLHFWILSQGAAITVMRPAGLRAEIVASLEASIRNYGER